MHRCRRFIIVIIHTYAHLYTLINTLMRSHIQAHFRLIIIITQLASAVLGILLHLLLLLLFSSNNTCNSFCCCCCYCCCTCALPCPALLHCSVKHVFVVLRRYHSLISKHLLLFCRRFVVFVVCCGEKRITWELGVCGKRAWESKCGEIGARALEFDVSMCVWWICGSGAIGFWMWFSHHFAN